MVVITENNLKKYPDDYITYYMLGQIYFQNINDKKKAKKYFEAFIKYTKGRASEKWDGPTSPLLKEEIAKAKEYLKKCDN